MRIIILAFITIFLSNCSNNNTELGNSYYYLDRFEATDIGYPNGAIIYKSPTKNLFKEIVISKQVVQVNHNDKYILAKQIVTDKIDTNYYIIDKINSKLFGPLTIDSCIILSKELQTEL